MRKEIFTKFFITAFIVSTLISGTVTAQAPWNGSFGNEWLQNKYNQKWLKIRVSAKGIQKVTLPANFMNGAAANTLHLYYRGEEVALISASTSEIQFYGVPNSGDSDALLYRPNSARINPYYSHYSDESSYFLTIGSPDGKRAAVENIASDAGSQLLTYHNQTDVTKFVDDYSHANQYSIRPTDMNSFMEDGQTRTSYRYNDAAGHPIQFGYVKDAATNVVLRADDFPALEIKKLISGETPVIKVLVYGRSAYSYLGGNPRSVHFHMGTSKSDMHDVGQVAIDGFKPGLITLNANFNYFQNNKSVVGFNLDSPKTELYFDRFSVAYYEMSYKQEIDMQGLNTYTFNFPGAPNGEKDKAVITTPPSGDLKFYDISDVRNPRIISGSASGLLFSRVNSAPLTLLATTATVDVDASKITEVQFSQITKSDFDYMIITNNSLENAAGEFASYRKNSSPGRKYKTGIFRIADLYNQFNYGEPSPLAIRRFVDYMVSDGNKDKFLLLMGKSASANYKIKKEMPDEVPTWGFPGSDVLLIEGLQGALTDVPVIPVGRIPAESSASGNTKAIAYLNKVKSYEAATSGLEWRKNVAHISGGKNQNEIDDHAGYLVTAAGKVKGGTFGGKVYTAVKPVVSDNVIPNDTLYYHVNSTPPVGIKNAEGKDSKGAGGLGFITYFGHSAPYQTDYDFGYVSDIKKKFNNPGKYPIMFYNGCDMLDTFQDKFAETVSTSESRPQSLDWLLSDGKGAIAVFGNSWAGYATSCNNFMQKVYDLVFNKTDQTRQPLGKILQIASEQIKQEGGFRMGVENGRLAANYIRVQAQIHQTLLIGDPALRILYTTEGGLPVDLVSFSAVPLGPDKVEVTWKTSSEINNSHFIVERSYNAKNFEEIGRLEGNGSTSDANLYTFLDAKPLSGKSYYRLTQVDESYKNTDGVLVEGTKTLSRIVSVDRKGTELISVYPNPSVEFVDIAINAPVNVKEWEILDVNGVVRKAGKGKKAELSNLTTGNYILKITTENKDVYYHKVVKK
ncbi:putative type IX secretion system sortase PorU2 [Dyadobacter luticola]|uniref:T9SS type A sorting domain-containing protein n=1 Tax=Dyadobacter luticola TaxID=1979387 RepID=A0A5R9KX98_9BACT|nr:C25 family cysteine peptidase [Dyadobacter luticola]TLV00729.1 T9SS type A sorting domain-containing protein [Dyadobacter luticola]